MPHWNSVCIFERHFPTLHCFIFALLLLKKLLMEFVVWGLILKMKERTTICWLSFTIIRFKFFFTLLLWLFLRKMSNFFKLYFSQTVLGNSINTFSKIKITQEIRWKQNFDYIINVVLSFSCFPPFGEWKGQLLNFTGFLTFLPMWQVFPKMEKILIWWEIFLISYLSSAFSMLTL